MTHLYVIAGHGAGDSGAVGGGYTEAERVRALASRIRELGGDAVTLHQTGDNAYASNAISRLSIPRDWAIVELHMDSGAPSAHGGHVIIKAGIGGADALDRAIAAGVTSLLPGRASAIVERSDLANPNRAYRRGYNYRLVECGFITSAQDRGIFNGNIDRLARVLLDAAGIGTQAQEAPKVSIKAEDRAVYRLYNGTTGDHMLTASHAEAEALATAGWRYEGVAFREGYGEDVYRLYNPYTGDHLFTTSAAEVGALVIAGWSYEGRAWSAGGGVEVYRLFNPQASDHLFTASPDERDALAKAGWADEGAPFRAL